MQERLWRCGVLATGALFAVGCAGTRTKPTSNQQPAAPVAHPDQAVEGGTMTQVNLTPEEAKRLLDSGSYVYLDVRTIPEYEAGRPPGAWNVPVVEPDASGKMSQNEGFLETVKANFRPDQRIIVGCRSGGRSSMATQMLSRAGFTRVYNMMGGFGGGKSPNGEDVSGWSELDFPIESGPDAKRGYEQLRAKAAE